MAIGSIIQLAPFSSTPSPPPSGFFEFYVVGTTIYLQDSSGNTYAFGSTDALAGLTGDVNATGPGVASATVVAIQGSAVSNIAPSDGQFLIWNSSTNKYQASSISGDGSLANTGAFTVNSVGGSSATNIHSAELAANAATPTNTASTIVKRDASGNFSANIITASLNGNASTATTSVNFSGSLLGDVTGTQGATVVGHVGGRLASDVAAATLEVDNATSINTASTLVIRDASGNFAANIISAALNGNATTATTSVNFIGSLLGDVTGTQGATTIASTVVTGKLLTGYVVGANTAISATDTILSALGKLQGQINNTDLTAITQLTGDVSAIGPGDVTATVNSVGGSSAANIHSAELAANAATNLNTASTIVKRDSSGNFSAGTITANLNGNVSATTVSASGSINNSSLTPSTVVVTDASDNLISSVTTATELSYVHGATSNIQTQLNSKMDNVATQNVYVAIQGSDITGDGSVGNPFASINHALSTITTAGVSQNGSNARYAVIVGAGAYNETQLLLKPYVTIVGDAMEGTYIRVNGGSGSVSLDPVWGTTQTSGRSGIVNCYFGHGTGLNFDFYSMGPNTGTPSAVIFLDGVAVTGTFNVTGRAPGIDYIELYDCLILGNATISDLIVGPGQGLNFGGTVNISGIHNTNSGFNLQFVNSAFAGAVTIGNTSSQPFPVQIAASNLASTLSVSGTGTAVTLDAISTPKSSNLTLTSPATITYTTYANSVAYSPTTPANWTIVPNSVQSGLDNLASTITSTIGAATSIDTPNTIVKRDGSGNFAAGTITASLSGNATNITATSNSTLTSLPILSLPGAQVTGNISGSAGSVSGTNVITNSNLAQMPADTIKGNNTGSTANATDLTGAQVTALLTPFVGDSGSGGTQGLVPAPAAGTKAAGDFLSANGTFSYVDQSKPIYTPFTLVGNTQYTTAINVKYENIATYTGIDGHKQYAAVVAGGGSGTLFVWDITNPVIPSLCSVTTLLGAYNVSVAQISGSIYAFVPSSGGSTLYTINITNPYSPTTTSSLAISGSPGSLYDCVYANGYVYIATQSKGLTVVDVGGGLAGGTITAPIQSFQEGGTTNKTAGVAIFGNFVYTTNYQTTFPATVRYLKTWELAAGGGTLAAPFLANTYTIPGGPTATSTKPSGIALNPAGTYAYVTDGNQNTVDIINITSPTSPSYVTYITPSYSLVTNTLEEVVAAVTVNGNYVYVPSGANATNGACIDLFDVTTPSAPIKLNSVYTGIPNDVGGGIALNNGYIFCADYGVSGSYSSLAVFTQAQLNPTFGLPITSNIQVEQLTANTALISNASQQLASSTTTATELSYVHGVTGPIQTQINSITGSGITGLTGDVNATGPGNVTATIQPNAVTNAKLAQMPANTIKGNSTGSTANAADLTESQVAGMLSSYFDASGSASTVQTNLNNYINPTSLQLSWNYSNPHYYTQMIYTGSNVTQIIYWDSPSMTTQLFTKNITYTGGLVTQVLITRISDGATLTKTIAYSGSQVSTVTRS